MTPHFLRLTWSILPRPASFRLFTTSAALSKTILPPRPKHPPEHEIEEAFVKGSGPGGQKILKHIPTGIVVKSQATRSRSENRKIARNILAGRLDELYNGSESRAAVIADVKQRKRASAAKKSRRKDWAKTWKRKGEWKEEKKNKAKDKDKGKGKGKRQ
ncbi:uncharacterized protein DNG_03363 [Cephalotrichum gorgonifer]|uniref:Prokaryotic-type class I peptide chain release factors domain-containing protein n=1 Tax=Cephalotrichum gorgonifer TaxID=2041049 RepID=A0AAE8SU69_9PEZI|nr:uncharacterized protein DNG_03363 [Cephalotrichum gorgonifer]